MPDERDRRTPKTPPPGVVAQIASIKPERADSTPVGKPTGIIPRLHDDDGIDSWEDQSSGGSSTGVAHRVQGESPIETVIRRSGETKNTTLDIQVKVGQLEVGVGKLEERVDSAHKIITESVLPSIGALQTIAITQSRQNDQIIGLLVRERDRSGEIKTETIMSQVKVTETEKLTENELKKARELSMIKQRDANSDVRRELFKAYALKLLAGLGVAAGIAFAAFQVGRC